MNSLIVVIAIILAIALGYKTGINTGFFGMAFAYLIGAFMLDLSPNAIIGMWPIRIFFVIMSVSLFYNFALNNGTLEKLALQVLYRFRKHPRLLPYIIFLSATLIAALGAGYFTVMAFLTPITLLLCNKTGMSKVLGALSVNYGALAGANFMVSPSGIIFRGLIENAGYNSNEGFTYSTSIFVATMIIPFIVLTGYVLVTWKRSSSTFGDVIDVDKPEEFTDKQKTNLNLIIIMIVVVLAVPLLNSIIPNNEVIAFINSKMDIGFIAIIMSIIAIILKLGDEQEAVAKVPWKTLIMICGVGMLISVAIEAGTIEVLSSWVALNIPTAIVPVALCVIAGIMSFFSSTLGVVAPALFPIVPAIAAATGLSPMLLFTCIVIGSQSTSISPFSSGGSLVLGSSATEEERTEMFPKLMFFAVPLCLLVATLFSIAISFIL